MTKKDQINNIFNDLEEDDLYGRPATSAGKPAKTPEPVPSKSENQRQRNVQNLSINSENLKRKKRKETQNVPIETDLLKFFKLYAVEHDTYINRVINEVLRKFVEQQK